MPFTTELLALLLLELWPRRTLRRTDVFDVVRISRRELPLRP